MSHSDFIEIFKKKNPDMKTYFLNVAKQKFMGFIIFYP